MLSKVYKVFIFVMLVVMAYAIGTLSGYAVGYNDKYSETVVMYKKR